MEARNKLYELGFTPGEVERQLSELIESGVLNEERFARAFAGGKFRMMAPHFAIEGEIVWGATAMMVNEFRSILLDII